MDGSHLNVTDAVIETGVDKIIPVIMSGGSGTRLWPLSTDARPKQFHTLSSEQTLLQDAVTRNVSDHQIEFLPPIIVCNHQHRHLVEAQVAGLHGGVTAIVLEPMAKNTAAVAAVAACLAQAEYPDALVLLTPADQVISDRPQFRSAIGRALQVARDRIVTFGIQPTAPETGYGYIQGGASIAQDLYEIARFVEKPDKSTAEAYHNAGAYTWNAGIFLFSPATMLDELQSFEPGILDSVRAALAAARRTGAVVELEAAAFSRSPEMSIDTAVMERTRRAAVAPCSIGWADLGCWSEIWRLSPQDANGNAIRGQVAVRDTRNSLVWSDGPIIAAAGLEDMIVVATQGGVVILPKARAQEVKLMLRAAQELAPAGSKELAPTPALISSAKRLVRWLEQDSLPLWADVGLDRRRGGFVEAIELDASPSELSRRARVQARQTYVYALASTSGWGGPARQTIWSEALGEGLDYLSNRYRRRDGLFRTLVHCDGSIADDNALLYDQAFVLFALAAAYRVWPERVDLLQQARDVLRCSMRVFCNPGHGLREASETRPFQSNPHMHLLEAGLAWSELDRHGPWPTLADRIAELCLTRFIDARTGALREFFEAYWRAAVGLEGRIVEPGQQFEWAWLLARWGVARGREDAVGAAERLYDIGSTFGVDQSRGVAVNALLDDFTWQDSDARLWPQTERIKAALILSEVGDADKRDGRRKEAVAAVRSLERYLDTPVRGLWWDKLTPSGGFVHEPASASSFYHIACAIAELSASASRLVGRAPAEERLLHPAC